MSWVTFGLGRKGDAKVPWISRGLGNYPYEVIALPGTDQLYIVGLPPKLSVFSVPFDRIVEHFEFSRVVSIDYHNREIHVPESIIGGDIVSIGHRKRIISVPEVISLEDFVRTRNANRVVQATNSSRSYRSHGSGRIVHTSSAASASRSVSVSGPGRSTQILRPSRVAA